MPTCNISSVRMIYEYISYGFILLNDNCFDFLLSFDFLVPTHALLLSYSTLLSSYLYPPPKRSFNLYPPPKRSFMGGILFSRCPSVRPSVRSHEEVLTWLGISIFDT